MVFTSDNGFALGEHRYIGKLCPWEECMKVPMVVRYPRLIAYASVDDRQVANIDLAPTFAEFAGVVPDRPVDGASFAPLLDGSATGWRTNILGELNDSVNVTPYREMRTAHFSYIEYSLVPPLTGQEAELYDRDADPNQMSSVAGNPTSQAIQSALAARVRDIDPSWTQTPP